MGFEPTISTPAATGLRHNKANFSIPHRYLHDGWAPKPSFSSQLTTAWRYVWSSFMTCRSTCLNDWSSPEECHKYIILIGWHQSKDSNPNKQFWRLPSYHWTTLIWRGVRDSNPQDFYIRQFSRLLLHPARYTAYIEFRFVSLVLNSDIRLTLFRTHLYPQVIHLSLHPHSRIWQILPMSVAAFICH